MPERCVYGMDQIQAGVDQCTVEVEDYQLERGWIELAIEFDQGCFISINDLEGSYQFSAVSSQPEALDFKICQECFGALVSS